MRHAMQLLLCAVALLALCLASPAQAADPTAPGSGRSRPDGQEMEYTLTLQVEGENLKGKLVRGPQARTSEISNGTYKDGELRFDVVTERGGNTLTSKYRGKIEGDTIKGTRQFLRPDGGEPRTRDWEAKRAG
jgi:hypothetical protein